MRHPPKTTARARVMVSGSSCGGAARNPPANPNPIASASGQMIDAIVDGWMEKEPETRGEAGKCTVKWMARPARAVTIV